MVTKEKNRCFGMRRAQRVTFFELKRESYLSNSFFMSQDNITTSRKPSRILYCMHTSVTYPESVN